MHLSRGSKWNLELFTMNNFTAVFNQGFSDRPILTSDISFFLSMKLIENNSRIRNREDKGKTDVTWAFLIDRRRQQYETPRFSSLVLDSLHFSAEETLDLDDDNDKPPNGLIVITNKEEASSYKTEQLRVQVFIYDLFCISFFSSWYSALPFSLPCFILS